MTDYQINLLDGDSGTAGTFNAEYPDAWGALGLARRMVGSRGEADVCAAAGNIGWQSGTSGTDLKALGEPWASYPSKQA